MEFTILTEKEYQAFFNSYQDASFMQSIELANLKMEYGSKVHLVGVKLKNRIVGGAMILEDKVLFNQKKFYSPRGLMLDYHDLELLTFFTTELKKYLNSLGGFLLTIDPSVIYRVRTSEGKINENYLPNDKAINNLLSLGFKHYGFNLYLDSLQARWFYRMKLDENYETKKSKFSKSTRKNIESCLKKGLLVRRGEINDLDVMTEIFDLTSKRKDFFSRSLSYYQKMYKNMSNLMTIYIAYLDPEIYYNHTKSLLEEEEKNHQEILEKMQKDNVGSKLLNKLKTSDKLIDKYQQELVKAEKFKIENPKGLDIGCLLSIKSHHEYLTLSSGVLELYKSFTPKYLMYEHHIKDAYSEGFKYCNFYGITGDFNPNGKYYGIYEFKKGFAGEVVEYIGEFDLKISNFYYLYKLLKKFKKIIRK